MAIFTSDHKCKTCGGVLGKVMSVSTSRERIAAGYCPKCWPNASSKQAEAEKEARETLRLRAEVPGKNNPDTVKTQELLNAIIGKKETVPEK